MGADIRTKKQQVCRAGDFLVAEIDAKVGGFGIVPGDLDGAIVSSHYFLFDQNQAKLDRTFLGYFCRSTDFRKQVSAQGSTNYAAIRPAHILKYEIPLPPLAEQQAIVARLDTLAGKGRQLTAHLDAIGADAVAFILSIHHKLAGGRSAPLSDLLELHEEREVVALGREYPQVGVRSFGGGLFAKPSVAAMDTTYRAFNTLFSGAIVLSQVKGWEGAIALTPPDLIGRFASPEYRTFRCIEGEANADYLGALFRTPWFWSLLQEATRGVGARRERTRPEQFLNVTLPMPPYADQCKAVEIFSRVDDLKVHHVAQRHIAANLLPATLERVFA